MTARNPRRLDDPDLTTAGRRVLVTIDNGVGAAIIDVDQRGIAHVQDTEVGHAGFAPSNDVEDRLLAELRRGGGATSWERVLLLAADAPEWAAAMSGSNRSDRILGQARLIGSLVSDLTLMYGAWRGALLTGSKVPHGTATNAVFEAGFVGKRSFRRLIQKPPAGRLTSSITRCVAPPRCLRAVMPRRSPPRRAAPARCCPRGRRARGRSGST